MTHIKGTTRTKKEISEDKISFTKRNKERGLTGFKHKDNDYRTD